MPHTDDRQRTLRSPSTGVTARLRSLLIFSTCAGGVTLIFACIVFLLRDPAPVVPADSSNEFRGSLIDPARSDVRNELTRSDARRIDREAALHALRNGEDRPTRRLSVVRRRSGRFVDYRLALADNPRLAECPRPEQVAGREALSVLVTAWASLRASTSLYKLKREIERYRSEHSRPPSFEELLDLLDAKPLEPARLRPHQVYAYDSQTGRIVVLEDAARGRRLERLAAGRDRGIRQ